MARKDAFFSINPIKLVTPDFLPGKIIFFIRAIFNICWLLLRNPSRQSLRLAGLALRIIPNYTMVMPTRLVNLYNLVHEANLDNMPGDIVQCGVWNGGSAAIMGLACQDDDQIKNRRIWLFDSFEGVPRPGEKDGKTEREYFFEGWNKGEAVMVKEVFDKLHVPINNITIVPGWFDATLPKTTVANISLLHIDADWYDSVKVVLNILYDRVVPGGFVILDDYGTWSGCKSAVNDFIKERGLEGLVIKKIDRSGAYFQKPK